LRKSKQSGVGEIAKHYDRRAPARMDAWWGGDRPRKKKTGEGGVIISSGEKISQRGEGSSQRERRLDRTGGRRDPEKGARQIDTAQARSQFRNYNGRPLPLDGEDRVGGCVNRGQERERRCAGGLMAPRAARAGDPPHPDPGKGG